MNRLYRYYHNNYEEHSISCFRGALYGAMGPTILGAGLSLLLGYFTLAYILYGLFTIGCILGIFLAFFKEGYGKYLEEIKRKKVVEYSIRTTQKRIFDYILNEIIAKFPKNEMNYVIKLIKDDPVDVFRCVYEMKYFDNTFECFIEFQDDTIIDPISSVDYITYYFRNKIDSVRRETIAAMRAYIFENDMEIFKTIDINTPNEEVENLYNTIKLKNELANNLKAGTTYNNKTNKV